MNKERCLKLCNNRPLNYLLQKYNNQYVKGEKISNTLRNKNRTESKRKHRHLLLDNLKNEAEKLNLNNSQIIIVRYLIDEFNKEFQELHRKASEETIILAFMFYVKMIDEPRTRIDKYRVSSKYNLTDKVYEIILCRMLLKFMKKCPIRPYGNYASDEHDILIREGHR